MKIAMMSDVHNKWGKIAYPRADVLVVAGDLTMMGREDELGKAGAYLAAMPYDRKIVIAGNHDWLFQTDRARAEALIGHGKNGVFYLQDDGVEIDGLNFWGSPWQPEFCDWAFNLPRGKALADKWALIPDDTDVLITHGPPHGILDQVDDGPHLGCEDLAARVAKVAPHLHVFGHIHDGYGEVERGGTTHINVSICDEAYRPVNAPVVKEIFTVEVTLA